MPSVQTVELAVATYAISLLPKQSSAELFIDFEQTINQIKNFSNFKFKKNQKNHR